MSGLSAVDLQTATIRRRLKLSPSVARAYADHVFGSHERDHVEAVHFATAARVAAASVGAPS